jgi:hypothetical protein
VLVNDVDFIVGGTDTLDSPLDETNTDFIENVAEWRFHLRCVDFVKAWTKMECWLRRNQHDLDRPIGCALAIEHAGRSKSAPHPGETGSNNKYSLCHDRIFFSVVSSGVTRMTVRSGIQPV